MKTPKDKFIEEAVEEFDDVEIRRFIDVKPIPGGVQVDVSRLVKRLKDFGDQKFKAGAEYMAEETRLEEEKIERKGRTYTMSDWTEFSYKKGYNQAVQDQRQKIQDSLKSL